MKAPEPPVGMRQAATYLARVPAGDGRPAQPDAEPLRRQYPAGSPGPPPGSGRAEFGDRQLYLDPRPRSDAGRLSIAATVPVDAPARRPYLIIWLYCSAMTSDRIGRLSAGVSRGSAAATGNVEARRVGGAAWASTPPVRGCDARSAAGPRRGSIGCGSAAAGRVAVRRARAGAR